MITFSDKMCRLFPVASLPVPVSWVQLVTALILMKCDCHCWQCPWCFSTVKHNILPCSLGQFQDTQLVHMQGYVLVNIHSFSAENPFWPNCTPEKHQDVRNCVHLIILIFQRRGNAWVGRCDWTVLDWMSWKPALSALSLNAHLPRTGFDVKIA